VNLVVEDREDAAYGGGGLGDLDGAPLGQVVSAKGQQGVEPGNVAEGEVAEIQDDSVGAVDRKL